jgi:phosphoserine aminotransferase
MNEHLASKISGFCVANLRNSLLLRAIRRLEPEYFEHNLLHPELIRDSLINTLPVLTVKLNIEH